MAKKPKAKVRQQTSKNLRRNLLFIPLVALVIKFIWLAVIPGHGMLGADGENYLSAVEGLYKDGIFSTVTNLHYWPAGYSILIWLFSLIHKSAAVTIMGVLQTILYCAGCAYFVDQIRRTRLQRFSYGIALILAFNPTLSLNSMALGYETPTASLILLGFGLLINNYLKNSNKVLNKDVLLAGVSFTVASFMQPRLMIIGFVFALIWGFAQYGKKSALIFIALVVGITLVGPAFMVVRNEKAMGFTAISTNLGTTMRLGAGPGATGGYSNKNEHPVPCTEIQGNAAQIDQHTTLCVMKWYLSNPSESLGLFIRKGIYFWSPWFGPVANGTMARNPWLKIDPVVNMAKTQDGFNTVYGNTGKLVSWIWLIGQIFFLYWGFKFLWSANGLERLIGISALFPILLSWATALLTIGDHRFRIPTMGLSLFLQIVGFMALFGGKSRLVGSQTPLRWKTFERNANLQP